MTCLSFYTKETSLQQLFEKHTIIRIVSEWIDKSFNWIASQCTKRALLYDNNTEQTVRITYSQYLIPQSKTIAPAAQMNS